MSESLEGQNGLVGPGLDLQRVHAVPRHGGHPELFSLHCGGVCMGVRLETHVLDAHTHT